MKKKALSIVILFSLVVIMTSCPDDPVYKEEHYYYDSIKTYVVNNDTIVVNDDTVKYNVIYDYGGVLGLKNNTIAYRKGTIVPLDRNKKINNRYELTGWSKMKDGKPESILTVDSDITLYAIWQKSYLVRVCYVKYTNYPDGNYSTVYSNDQYYKESTYTYFKKSQSIYDGYTCIGWTTEGVGSKLTKDTFNLKLNSDTIMYVMFEKNTFDISFDLNGGIGIQPSTLNIKRGDYLNYTSLPTTGFSYGVYTFEGWSETKNGKVITSDFKPDKDMTLYAVWSHNGQVKDKTDDN